MNSFLKSVLMGILLGLSPILLCLLLYKISPSIVEKNQTDLLSFGLMGVYALASLAVFVIAMILLIIKNKPIIGGVAFFVMIAQLIVGVSYMAGI
jgi:hypothetical protein